MCSSDSRAANILVPAYGHHVDKVLVRWVVSSDTGDLASEESDGFREAPCMEWVGGAGEEFNPCAVHYPGQSSRLFGVLASTGGEETDV